VQTILGPPSVCYLLGSTSINPTWEFLDKNDVYAGVVATYTGGSSNGCVNNVSRSAIYEFQCKQNTGVVFKSAEAVQPLEQCQYRLIFESAFACPTVTFLGKTDHSLSGGWVFIIIVLVVASVYCVFGSIYNYKMGRRGREVVPNIDFWTDLPSLVMEGFSAAFYMVTCQNRRVQRSTYDDIDNEYL
jgi:Autophagy-related protein 27